MIGTYTNILVYSIVEKHQIKPLGMFEFATLGLVFFGIGLLYMVILGVRLIPERRKEEEQLVRFGLGDYLLEIVLLPEAKSVGKTVQEAPLVQELGIEILEVRRDGKRLYLPASKTILQAGDILKVLGDVEQIGKLGERTGIILQSKPDWHDTDLQSEEVILVEAVIAPNSFLVNKSLKEAQFRNIFGATALAIRHHGQVLHHNIANTKLQAGDVLLIEVRTDQLEHLRERNAFVLVTETGLPKFRKKKIIPAFLIMGAVIASATFGWFPIVVSAIVGSILMVLTGCITLDEAYKSIEWKVIFLLAGALTLAVALEKTGTAHFISALIVSAVGKYGPVALISAFYLLTTLLTNVMSNNATAALITPIAIVTAQSLQVDPRGLIMAVVFAASSSFMTPVGYQTNAMILEAG